MNSTSILKSKFYSLSTFQLYSTVLSTSVTMFYLRFSDLIPLIARSFFRSYLLSISLFLQIFAYYPFQKTSRSRWICSQSQRRWMWGWERLPRVLIASTIFLHLTWAGWLEWSVLTMALTALPFGVTCAWNADWVHLNSPVPVIHHTLSLW